MAGTVIFDLDGTLIDTEKYFKVFWRQAAAAFGYQMSEEQALQLRSLGRPYAPALLQEWFGKAFEYVAVREYRRKIMKEHLDKAGIELKPYAEQALSWLSKNGYRTAIATATPVERATEQLQQLGIAGYFDEIVSAASVEKGKPAPDVYLYACEKLGESPKDCFAVEDSPNGVLSAYAAGLKVIMVPDQTEPDAELAAKLYACISSLGELSEVLDVNYLEMAKKRDHKIIITDEAINKVPRIKYKDIPESEYDNLWELAKNVLKISKEENDSNEVAITYSLDSANMIERGERYIGVALGSEHDVDPLSNTTAYHLISSIEECVVIVLHNHPSLSDFSLTDVQFLLRYSNVKMMVVVTNLGSISYLVKGKSYDLKKAIALFNEAVDKNNGAEKLKDLQSAADYFLKNSHTVGINYDNR